MNYKKVETGLQEEGKLQCVFALIYCKDALPYKHYTEVTEDIKSVQTAFVLMQLRWNGQFGFAGGKVDPGEDLKQALIRELIEEINFETTEDKLLPLATFSDNKSDIHSFSIEVTYEELLKIKDDSALSKHNIAENLGSVFAPIINSQYHEYNNFLQNNFCATAKSELETLVNENNLLTTIK